MTNRLNNELVIFWLRLFKNDQYSLWPSFREIPQSWNAIGPRGKRKDCLDRIEASRKRRPRPSTLCRVS